MGHRRMQRMAAIALAVVMLLGLAACGKGDSSASAVKLTIGSKLDVDGQLNAEMYALLLKEKGYDVTTKLGLGQTPVLDQALKSGSIDIYPEFTGTAISTLKLQPTQDAKQAYEEVRTAYKDQFNLTMLDPAYQLNDSYAICTSQDMAAKHNLKSLDDLAAMGSTLSIAAQQEESTLPSSRSRTPTVSSSARWCRSASSSPSTQSRRAMSISTSVTRPTRPLWSTTSWC